MRAQRLAGPFGFLEDGSAGSAHTLTALDILKRASSSSSHVASAMYARIELLESKLADTSSELAQVVELNKQLMSEVC